MPKRMLGGRRCQFNRETKLSEISQVRETGTRAYLAPPGQPSDNCASAPRATTRCGRNREQGCPRRRRCSMTPPPHVLPTRRIAHTRTPRSFARSVRSVAGAAPSGPPAASGVRLLYIFIFYIFIFCFWSAFTISVGCRGDLRNHAVM